MRLLGAHVLTAGRVEKAIERRATLDWIKHKTERDTIFLLYFEEISL